MEYQDPNIAPYAKVAIKLLQGAVFEDQTDLWNEVIQYQVPLIQYFEKIALDLVVDKRDGYAYLKQKPLDDTGTTIGLIRRIPLTYELTLVCVFLRDWLHEFEANDMETANLYITIREFRERLELFFKDRANEVKFIRDLKRHIESCVSMDFLKLVHNDPANPDEDRYEVKRIIKARVTLDELTYFKQQLEDESESL
ncbi:MAG: hypothetical protein CMI36_16450 [Owenweeksia sp.]|nr:hypothetical protein [Micavibrio sp.]MBG00583.1 hypothetical protein [Owenweeksia sp.]|tara:strand:- start:611 stop:1201 length:591 start_codon:yes stop_codon:yes gene_type:complete